MIYTVTPNPTLDLGGKVDRLVPNEKNYVHDETRFPGGNAINAARLLRRLGLPVMATGFLGGGIGAEVETLLRKEGVTCHFVKVKDDTRIGLTVSNLKSHLQTRLSFPGPHIRATEWKTLFRKVTAIKKPGIVLIGGSLPPGITATQIGSLVRSLRKLQIPSMIDVPGPLLRTIISAQPEFIKPNLVEFQALVGKKVSSVPNVLREARKLNRHVSLVCVSSVEGGALLVTRKYAWFGRAPKVKVRTTVGAGDSMVGAIAARLWKCLEKGTLVEALPDETIGDLLRWGLAAAAATLETYGTELGNAKAIQAYYRKTQVERISGSAE
jgi:1-phosphofructokinase family hexose kinase